jgi:hypothetical protein
VEEKRRKERAGGSRKLGKGGGGEGERAGGELTSSG